ncbi:S-adenosyl-L-methionine-dependent methyltransferase [Xylariaceae sp. FL0594]|nr:S-adenosyl-L-methionine-dependent methyltransferase [Xylariaceae sp. FL0594]
MPEDIYADNMSRDLVEAQRLDEQFTLLTSNIGYLLHPLIASALPPKPHVADIGTGTGIFLRRMHDLYPEATLHGYDISADLYPEPQTLPSNMRLSTLDVKAPIPPELHGAYDLVHVRLLAAAMLPAEWAIVVRNVSRLLKPGGYIQWVECDFSGVKHMRGRPESTFASARLMGTAFREALRERFEHGWSTLPRELEAAGGLKCVHEDVVSSDRVPETRARMTRNGMVAIFKWAHLMTARNVPGSFSLDRLAQLKEEVEADIESGCYVRFDIYIACGQRPHSS